MKHTPDPADDPFPTTEEDFDPGAYIGRGEEFAAEKIPGGVQRNDERIAGTATQSTGPANRGDVPPEEVGWPEGHRELRHVTDDDIREAGLNR
jgi:hypothetical protein